LSGSPYLKVLAETIGHLATLRYMTVTLFELATQECGSLSAASPVNRVATASLLLRETRIDNLELYMAFEVKYGGCYEEFCLLGYNVF
jgi:hypothetical protein